MTSEGSEAHSKCLKSRGRNLPAEGLEPPTP
jgi:hypothetical protein